EKPAGAGVETAELEAWKKLDGFGSCCVRTASRAVRTAAGPQLDRNRTAGLAVRTAKLRDLNP
ncbi:hypothetical protein THAOC_21528, partial [Thalassiosira oceanica]